MSSASPDDVVKSAHVCRLTDKKTQNPLVLNKSLRFGTFVFTQLANLPPANVRYQSYHLNCAINVHAIKTHNNNLSAERRGYWLDMIICISTLKLGLCNQKCITHTYRHVRQPTTFIRHVSIGYTTTRVHIFSIYFCIGVVFVVFCWCRCRVIVLFSIKFCIYSQISLLVDDGIDNIDRLWQTSNPFFALICAHIKNVYSIHITYFIKQHMRNSSHNRWNLIRYISWKPNPKFRNGIALSICIYLMYVLYIVHTHLDLNTDKTLSKKMSTFFYYILLNGLML